ncbi:serine hydrolase [Streptomyces sp. NPDC001828]|uniref:serine hydrolase n=1 Tax=Streptomyces sp. NPDC001828 TaxID=3364615 RepID=UPI0036828B3A
MVRTVSDDATRRLEEASVAGESPDKSEQQQSSGETTTSERDPRIAGSHSPSPAGESGTGSSGSSGSSRSSGSSGASGKGEDAARAANGSGSGSVDQATAVFRAPRQEDGDSRLRAAVAAWVDQEADSPSEEPSSDNAVAVDADADAGAGTGADAEAEAEGAAEPAKPAKSAGSAKPAEPAKSAGSASPAEPAKSAGSDKAVPASAETAVAPGTDEVSDSTEGSAKSDAGAPVKDAEPETPAAAAAAKPSPAEREPQPEAAKAAKASDDVKAPEAAKASDDVKAPEQAKASEAAEAGKPKAAEAGAGIDQPTAVFKAPKAPAVDQPTAMLKLPAPQREPEAERAAERTSQFVPLRSDDAGTGTKKPEAPARRPAAPKVTPPPSVGFGAAPASGATPPVPDRAERTRQQPLPPKPPLDLLAELTNTPPPAQTAVRSTVRRFKIWTPLVLLLLVVFAVVQIMRPLPDPKLALTSKATYSFDGGALDLPWPAEGQSAVAVDGVGSLGTHGEQKPAPLASVAKTMTAYVILKGHPISGKQEGDKITVDQQAEDDAKKPDESTAPIRKDQQFTEKQMLELLMIPSGNNAARLLARWDAGSEEAFIAKMNDAAKSLGMTNTTYTDPSGLKETTVSTPADQLKLAQAVMQNDVFRGIVNTPQIKIPGIDSMIYNNNTILLKPGVSGIKTGSSTPAGGNLLWAADTVVDGKNQRIYGVVMGQRTGTTLDNKLKSAINSSYTLIKAVQNAVTSATVVKKGDVVGYVDDGLGGRTPVVATKDLKAVGWPGLKVDVTLGSGDKPVPHTAKAGDIVGELSIGTGNGKVTAPVQLKSAMAEPGVGDKLTRLG